MTRPRGAPVPFTPEWWRVETIPNPITGCLLWPGRAVGKSGHCQTWRAGKRVLVHRMAYESAFGLFNPDLKVCHSCDVANCVNPDHLFLGTQKDNLRDMFRKGRARPQGTPARRFNGASITPQKLAARTGTKCGQLVDALPLIRTIGESASDAAPVTRWYEVTGVPLIQPTRALVLYNRPKSETENNRPDTRSRDTGALMAGVRCPSVERDR